MNAFLFFLLACALVGLLSSVNRRKAYMIAVLGAGVLAGAYFGISGIMQ